MARRLEGLHMSACRPGASRMTSPNIESFVSTRLQVADEKTQSRAYTSSRQFLRFRQDGRCSAQSEAKLSQEGLFASRLAGSRWGDCQPNANRYPDCSGGA